MTANTRVKASISVKHEMLHCEEHANAEKHSQSRKRTDRLRGEGLLADVIGVRQENQTESRRRVLALVLLEGFSLQKQRREVCFISRDFGM